jgi:hypothetical protein
VVFKHHFFSAHPYYLRFHTSEQTTSTIEEQLDAEACRLRAKGIIAAHVGIRPGPSTPGTLAFP